MDVAFEILLPIESSISLVKLEQTVFEWGGIKYPQGREEAWFHFLKLTKSMVPLYILKRLPLSFQKQEWQCISIKEGVNSLIKGNDKVLIDLFKGILEDESRWIVVFEPDYDRIDWVSKGDINICYEKILESLRVKKQGFIIWHDISLL